MGRQAAAQSADQAASPGWAGAIAPCSLRLRFGVAQFDRYDPLADIGKLDMWGFDYCEPQLGKVMALSEAEFQTVLKKARASPIHVEAMNSFIPADLKVVGSQVDRPRLRAYLQKALGPCGGAGSESDCIWQRRCPHGAGRFFEAACLGSASRIPANGG